MPITYIKTAPASMVAPVTGKITMFVDTTGTTKLIDEFGNVTSVGTGTAPSKAFFNVLDYGVVADGTTDNSAAIYAVYQAARTAGTTSVVVWPAGVYNTTGTVNAVGVSSVGYGAKILGTFTGTSGAGFGWGGTDTYVCGFTFSFSNTSTTVPIQGVYNAVNGCTNQRFFNNHIISTTTLSGGTSSNVYGLWIIGTGLSGLYIYGNHIQSTTYGIQYNAQGTGDNVLTAPYGSPSSDIHVYDNTCIDAALGINTPDIYCNHVFIHNNSVRAVNFAMDIPLNIAHVSNLNVSGNTVVSNIVNSPDGSLHIEDASASVTVNANVISCSGAGSTGLFIGAQSGVSGDIQPTRRIVVTGNHINGVGVSGTSFGIITNDNQTMDTTITGNYISAFTTGVCNFQEAVISGNTVANCTYAFNGTGYATHGINEVNTCTNYFGAVGSEQIVNGGTALLTPLTPIKQNIGSMVLYKNISVRQPVTSIVSGSAFDTFKLPTTASTFNVTVMLGGGFGYAAFSVVSTGTTITVTAGAKYLPGVISAVALTRNATSGALAVTCTTSASTASNMTLVVENIVY